MKIVNAAENDRSFRFAYRTTTPTALMRSSSWLTGGLQGPRFQVETGRGKQATERNSANPSA